MLSHSRWTHQPDRFAARMLRALEWPRVAAAVLTAFLLSVGTLASPGLLGFFSPTELALAWAEHSAELAVLASCLLPAYTLLDELLPSRLPWRLAILCVLLSLAACGLAVIALPHSPV
ncbi:hypothetical protein JJB11_10870 [Ramlibacter ginsenosidimutans]|uniref:Uncharacterized protein n=1 Tax=Ramlibacter ginsenosidimutans TaxID=502333 RepID=A0A934TTG0_9BURK|nr:hypothetical protein [Ramlibacter ginsenosidimutans]MBK6006595.1 hypothetical protein [Ramlibacter ginsenosidimutans]